MANGLMASEGVNDSPVDGVVDEFSRISQGDFWLLLIPDSEETLSGVKQKMLFHSSLDGGIGLSAL